MCKGCKHCNTRMHTAKRLSDTWPTNETQHATPLGQILTSTTLQGIRWGTGFAGLPVMGGKPVYSVSTGFIFVHYRYRPVSFPPQKSRLTSQTGLALGCFWGPFWPFLAYLRGGQPPLGHNRYQPVLDYFIFLCDRDRPVSFF